MPPLLEIGARPDIEALRQRAMTCEGCALAKGRTQVVWAKGSLEGDLLFIGEAPGFHEDKQGIPFVGAAGQLLDRVLDEVGIDKGRAAVVNVLKCRPPNNRDPEPEEIEACRPFLEGQLRYMQPHVIVTLGNFATRFVIGEPIGITKARGRTYSYMGATVVPTFHPAAALRGGRSGGVPLTEALRDDLRLAQKLLESKRAEGVQTVSVTSAEEPSEQLGLF